MKISSSNKVWDEFVEKVPCTFGHSRFYNQLIESEFGDKTFLFVASKGDKIAGFPFCERSYFGHIDVYSPYGWSGLTPCEEDWAWNVWDEYAANEKYICSYIVTNPLLTPKPPNLFENSHHLSYVMDINKNDDSIFKSLHRSNRNLIKRGLQGGRTITFDSKIISEFFKENYAEFCKRKNMSKAYKFSSDFFDYLIPRSDVLTVGVEFSNHIESASIFCFSPFGAEYFLSVTKENCDANDRHIIWAAIQKLQARGIKLLNLGCGVEPGDDLCNFKRRFGGLKTPVFARKKIHSKKLFDILCAQTGADPENSSYFPPYHKS